MATNLKLLNLQSNEVDDEGCVVLGNLLENAARFAAQRVCVTIAPNTAEDPEFTIVVEDDGPGMTDDEMGEAARRGKRFDEMSAGFGLGLSIVRDIAIEYRGRLSLSRSPLGGLRAAVFLPSAASTTAPATDHPQS